MMQLSSSANLLLPTGKGFFNLAGRVRGRRPRSTTRAQEAAILIDETLSFFVKATGKDETSLRQQLTNQKCEELRRSRDHWKTHAEEEERFQRTKEEARRLFERQPGVKRKTREEFEEEYKRKVREVMSSSRSERGRWCKSGQVKCRRSSNLRSGDVRPVREPEWNRRIQTPNDNEHGRKLGD